MAVLEKIRYERESIRLASGYVPGEQRHDERVVRLNTNENPYPPAPSIGEILRQFDPTQLRTYPPPHALPFRKIAATLHHLSPNQIIATNGGDEFLRLALTTFVEPGGAIGLCSPTYSLYEVLAQLHGASILDVPLNQDWSLSEDTAKRWNDANAQLAFVVNPQAPSGYLISADLIDALGTEFNGVLVVDEAYSDFIDPSHQHNILSLIPKHDNLLILRTLSKGYSLAGLRFGYGMGSTALIDPMQSKTKDSYNTDTISQALACAALQDQPYARAIWRRVRRDRQWLYEALGNIGFLCESSQANFLLANVPAGQCASEVYETLRARNILVRYFDTPSLRNRLRITVGTPTQNHQLITELTSIVGGYPAP